MCIRITGWDVEIESWNGGDGDGEITGKTGEDQPERNVVSVLCSGDEQSDSGSFFT